MQKKLFTGQPANNYLCLISVVIKSLMNSAFRFAQCKTKESTAQGPDKSAVLPEMFNKHAF